jgi:hypothetical protein
LPVAAGVGSVGSAAWYASKMGGFGYPRGPAATGGGAGEEGGFSPVNTGRYTGQNWTRFPEEEPLPGEEAGALEMSELVPPAALRPPTFAQFPKPLPPLSNTAKFWQGVRNSSYPKSSGPASQAVEEAVAAPVEESGLAEFGDAVGEVAAELGADVLGALASGRFGSEVPMHQRYCPSTNAHMSFTHNNGRY